MKLGVRKVIVASSETTYGVCFAEGDKDFHAFPLEEDYDVDPMDSYGLSKVCNEKTARAFAMRYGADIYALRIGNVIEPHEYGMFKGFLADPPSRKRCAWSYIDARDLGEIVRLCLEKDGLGFQVFNADQRHDHPRTRRPRKRWRSSPRTRPSPAPWASTTRRCRTARRARCWASRRSTTGGSYVAGDSTGGEGSGAAHDTGRIPAYLPAESSLCTNTHRTRITRNELTMKIKTTPFDPADFLDTQEIADGTPRRRRRDRRQPDISRMRSAPSRGRAGWRRSLKRPG